MSALIASLINGQASDTLSVLDRALHYGDGVFETLEYTDGQIIFWTRHVQRLQHGCARIGLDPPDPAHLQRDVTQLLHTHQQGVIKILITAGVGGRGYQRSHTHGQCIMLLFPSMPPTHPQGIRLHTCETRLGRNTSLAGIKHLNRLEQVMAKRELPQDCHEGLMLDEQGNVIEGIMSNIFCLQGPLLRTPKLKHCGVSGIIRNAILALAPSLHLTTKEAVLKPSDLLASDEIFVCNSLIHIWPVRQWGHWHCQHHPITEQLTRALKQMMTQHAMTLHKGSIC